MAMQRLGLHIRKLRQLKNYTQSYVADRLKMSSSGYGKLERGDTDISMRRLEEVAIILGVSIEEIIFFDEEEIITGKNHKAEKSFSTDRNPDKFDGQISDPMNDHNPNLIAQLQEENRYLKELFQSLLRKKNPTQDKPNSGGDFR